MLTIHQPSSALYECFDRLLLLAPGGRTVFFGDVPEAVGYFTSLGYPLPALWTPSDHFIELISTSETCGLLCDAWATREPAAGPPLRPTPSIWAPMPPLSYQIRVLMPRTFLRIQRSYLKLLSWKMHIALAVVWGLIYFGVGSEPHERLNDFVGAIFFIVAHWSWTPLFQGLMNFPREKDMLTKERASKIYDIKAFFLTQVLAEAPLLLVLPVVFFAIVWPMSAFPFFVLPQVFLLVTLNIQVCSSMSMFISVVCMDQDTAISTAIVAMVFEMCAGGYFADLRLLPWWIGWVRFASFYYYTFGAVLRLMVAEPFGEELHRAAISKYSFSDLGYLSEVTVLFLMSVMFRAAAYVQLRITKRLDFS
jgi:hypothetical protein